MLGWYLLMHKSDSKRGLHELKRAWGSGSIGIGLSYIVAQPGYPLWSLISIKEKIILPKISSCECGGSVLYSDWNISLANVWAYTLTAFNNFRGTSFNLQQGWDSLLSQEV